MGVVISAFNTESYGSFCLLLHTSIGLFLSPMNPDEREVVLTGRAATSKLGRSVSYIAPFI